MMSNMLFPILLVFYEITTYLSNDMYLPALPQLAHDFAIGHAATQLTLTYWFLGTASMQLILGPLSDRFGRRIILIMGGVLFLGATIICAAITDFSTFLLARFIQGCAVCSVTVAGYASIHELFDQKQSMKILALMASITLLAPAFGPTVGGLIVHFTDWRILFWLLAILSAITILLLFFFMPETWPASKRHPLHLMTLISQYQRIMFNKKFWVYALPFCLNFCGLIAWLSMGPFLVIQNFHFSPILFGFAQAFVFGSYIIGSTWVKKSLDNISPQKFIRFGFQFCLAGATLAFVVSYIFPAAILPFILCLMLYSFGASLSFGPLQRYAIEASSEPMGIKMAVFSTAMSSFGVIGTLASGALYNGHLSNLAVLLLILAFIPFLTLLSKA